MGKGRRGVEGTQYDDNDDYWHRASSFVIGLACCLSFICAGFHVTNGDVAPASQVRKGDGEGNPAAHLGY